MWHGGAMVIIIIWHINIYVCVCAHVHCLLSHFSCVWLCDTMDHSPTGSSVHGILQTRIPGCPHLLQGIFPTQGSNPRLLCLLHCRWILYPLSHLGNPGKLYLSIHLSLSLYIYIYIERERNQMKVVMYKINSTLRYILLVYFTVPYVQFSSVAQSCSTLCDSMNCSMPGLPVHHQLPEFTQTHAHRVGDAIQPSHPPSSPFPPAPNPSQHQGLFQWDNSLHEVAEVLEFQLQDQSFQWTPKTDLLRMEWLDLLAVWGTLKSLLQQRSSKASIFWRSAFFTVLLSHPYMTTGKTIALIRQTFVGKVMSLLFNMLI